MKKLEIKIAQATQIVPLWTTAKIRSVNMVVKNILILKEIAVLLIEFSNNIAAQLYILGITERQIKIRIGIAGIHFSPKTMGT